MGKKLLMIAAALAWGTLSAQASSGPSPLGLQPEPVPGFEVSIQTDKSRYTIGDTARIQIHLSQRAYVYVFNIDSSGQVTQIFPNYYSQAPYLSRGTHILPDRPTYRLRVTGPEGVDTLKVIASTQPLRTQTGTQGEPFPLMAPDPQRGQAHIQGLVPEPVDYVTAWTTFEVVRQPQPPSWGWPPAPRPPQWHPPGVPPFGWGWYYHDGSWYVFIGECPREAQLCWRLTEDGQWRFSFRIRIGN